MTFDDIIAPGTRPDVLGEGYGFCEGPAADARGNVYFSDGKHDSIHYYEVGKPVTQFVSDSTDANGMMFNARGELCVCEGAAHRIVAIDVKTRQKRVLIDQIDGTPFNEPNDLAVDRQGGFYFSDPNYQHRGQPTVMKQDTYYCSVEGRVARVSTVCFKPNGVLLSTDDRTLYVADARGQRIFRYKVLGPGRLAEETLWIDGLGANPDGLTLDEHDNLYICLGRSGMKVFSPEATLLGVVDVPYASNTCFGGPDFQTLLITSDDKFLGIQTQVVGLKPLCLRSLC